jgi:catechol 2,3-dioxygenase-like lactoylglutathione lyase family enzyme
MGTPTPNLRLALPGTVALVPELEVSDFSKSLEFYVDVIGFSVLYDRPERPFAFLGLGSAQLMIEHGEVGLLACSKGRSVAASTFKLMFQT